MITLYHSPGTRSLRCLWALEELHLPYALEIIPFPPRVKAPEYLQINATGTVPLLIDGSTRLNESGAILEYLATRYDTAQLRVMPDEEAYGSWLNWIHYGEATLLTRLSSLVRFAISLPKEERIPAVAEDFARMFLERLAPVEAALAGQDHLCAGRFTVADISVGYALYLGKFLRLHDRYSSTLTDYLERLQTRRAFQAAVQQEQAGNKTP